jgi:hypothetical protein
MTVTRKRDPESRWQAIRLQMEQNAYHLGRRSSIVAKWAYGGRRWVLRFYAPDHQGRFVQRSLYLGSDDAWEVVHRVRELLQHYRREADSLAEIPLFARFSAEAVAILLRFGRRRGTTRRLTRV